MGISSTEYQRYTVNHWGVGTSAWKAFKILYDESSQAAELQGLLTSLIRKYIAVLFEMSHGPQ